MLYFFFSLVGFLTAVLQNHSRKEGISVDELMFDFKIMMGPDDTEEVLSNTKEHINVKEVAFQVRGYHFFPLNERLWISESMFAVFFETYSLDDQKFYELRAKKLKKHVAPMHVV